MAVTRRVRPKNRHPSRRRVTSFIPSLASRAWCCRVARTSAIISRPPGRSTRTASLMAFSRPACPRMLWIAILEITRSKLSVFQGQRHHVGRVQFDTIGYPLLDGIPPGGLGGIARLIDASPQVHTHRPARGQVLGGHEQDRTSATSQVQDSLIPPKVQLVEQFGPHHELASQGGVEVEPENCQDEQGGQQWPHTARDDGEGELQSGQDGQENRRKGASIPYEPRRRGATRSVIRIAFSSRVFLHSDEAAVPHDPTAVSRFSHESGRLPRPEALIYK